MTSAPLPRAAWPGSAAALQAEALRPWPQSTRACYTGGSSPAGTLWPWYELVPFPVNWPSPGSSPDPWEESTPRPDCAPVPSADSRSAALLLRQDARGSGGALLRSGFCGIFSDFQGLFPPVTPGADAVMPLCREQVRVSFKGCHGDSLLSPRSRVLCGYLLILLPPTIVCGCTRPPRLHSLGFRSSPCGGSSAHRAHSARGHRLTPRWACQGAPSLGAFVGRKGGEGGSRREGVTLGIVSVAVFRSASRRCWCPPASGSDRPPKRRPRSERGSCGQRQAVPTCTFSPDASESEFVEGAVGARPLN